MTAQVPDTLRIDGAAHDLVAARGSGLFDPAAHGLPVVMASTACYRGYVCGYTVADDRLELDTLEARIGRYAGDDFVAIEPPTIGGRAPERLGGRGQAFNVAYRGLALAIPCTGQLLIASDRIDELSVEMGFAPAWTYRRVWQLDFDRGGLRGREDLSTAMAAARAQGPRPGQLPSFDRADLAWIVESFVLPG